LNQTKKHYAEPDELYTIKVSHAEWDVHWEKTMHDIEFLHSKGCKVIEPFYQALYKDWERIHGKKKVNLNKTNEKFFTRTVVRHYDHDFLHAQMAYYDEPMYQKMKFDRSLAKVEKVLFNKFSESDKLRAVREETCVIALERYVITSKFKINPYIAYRRALKDLIIHLTKGWFARYMIEHHGELKKFEDIERYKQFIEKEKREY
jgi:hypothetical protein